MSFNPPTTCQKEVERKLTGEVRYRLTWKARLILLVEEEIVIEKYKMFRSDPVECRKIRGLWRYADLNDIAELERLRHKPNNKHGEAMVS